MKRQTERYIDRKIDRQLDRMTESERLIIYRQLKTYLTENTVRQRSLELLKCQQKI